MNDLTKALLNTRSLRAASKDLSLEQLEDTLTKLTAIVEDRRATAEEELAAQAEKKAKMDDILAQLKESGISPEELLSSADVPAVKVKAKREPRPAKYIYEHEGETKTWTGQGRMPLALQEIMNAKGSIEHCLI